MASILETFYILFKSDTSELKKGSKEADKITRNLQDSLKKSDRTTVQLGNSFGTLARQLSSATFGFLTISSLFNNIGTSIKNTDKLFNFSKLVGISTQEIQSWGNAVREAGGDVNSFESTISGLNNQLLDIQLTGKSAFIPIFNQLGVGVLDVNGKLKDSITLLRDIGASLKQLPESSALSVAQRLGIDPVLARLLISGEIDNIINKQNKINLLNNKQIESIRSLRESWEGLKTATQGASNTFNSAVSPALSKVYEGLRNVIEYLSENENIVKGILIGIGLLITKALIPLVRLVNPFNKITAALIALGFAYDDFVTFLKGGDSVIGRFLERFPKVADLLKGIGNFFGKGKNIVSQSYNNILGNKEPIIIEGKQLLESADSNPLSGGTPSNILNNSSNINNRSFNININQLDINTQATDTSDIANDILSELQKQTQNAVDNFDDGLLA